jgi:hypothetical protein
VHFRLQRSRPRGTRSRPGGGFSSTHGGTVKFLPEGVVA